MDFKEWWDGSGMVRGESIFRNCWDAAIDAAAAVCALNASDQGEWSDGAAACERNVLELKTAPR